jgi:CheY-like chemotaxis protein
LTSRVALVVDDSILIRRVVQRFLEDRGYAVETACNGVEGLTALDRLTPELIVTDLVMPKMGGTEFIREIRYRPNFAQIPIILIAGRKSPSAHAPVAGADHVVYKNVDLVEQLKLVFDKFRPAKAVPKSSKKDQTALG